MRMLAAWFCLVLSFSCFASDNCANELTVLTREQRDFFQQSGFLVLDGFAEAEECDALRERALALVSQCDFLELASIFSDREGPFSWESYYLDKGQRLCFFFEDQAFHCPNPLKLDKSAFIKKISYTLHEDDPLFKGFSYQENIRRLLQDLGMCEPLPVQSMYLFKQPRIGSAVSCHQDSSFIHTSPDSLIGLWIALEDATVENGCLWVLPGAHESALKFKMLKDAAGNIGYEIGDEAPWPLERMVPLQVSKGSLIVMHGHLPHLSQANLSEQSRHAYALHFIDGRSEYLPSNWLPLQKDRGIRAVKK